MAEKQHPALPETHGGHLFISYSRKDKGKVQQIIKQLQGLIPFTIWMDTKNIQGGKRWDRTLNDNISNAVAVLYFVSPSSYDSPNVAHELDIAQNNRRPIYPIWIDGTNWNNIVIFGHSREQYYDFRASDHTSQLERLIQDLSNLADNPPPPPPPPITHPPKKVLRSFTAIGLTALITLLLISSIPIPVSGYLYHLVVKGPSSQATTISHTVTVTSTADHGAGTLREAVQYANTHPGTAIQFSPDLKGHAIDITSDDLEIINDTTLQGLDNITQQFNNCFTKENREELYDCLEQLKNNNILFITSSVGKTIHISSNAQVTIKHLAFSDRVLGSSDTAFFFNQGTLILQGCLLHDNHSTYNGGAITNNRGHLTLKQSVLFKNNAGGNGGGLYNLFGTVSLYNSAILDNIAHDNGGGIYSLGGEVNIYGSEVSRNQAPNDLSVGGGIADSNGILTIVENSNIQYNHAADTGGGIALFGAKTTIDSSNIAHNTAGKQGAGIAVTRNPDNNYSSVLEVTGITINNPQAFYYIDDNQISDDHHTVKEQNIAGHQISKPGDSYLLYTDDPAITVLIGNPATPNPPIASPNLLGIADINAYCVKQGYNYGISDETIASGKDGLNIRCVDYRGNAQTYATRQICQDLYPSASVDRFGNFRDPTTLQCYKNASRLDTDTHSISQYFNQYCQSVQVPNTQGHYTEAIKVGSTPHTAYDWKCHDQKTDATAGISVTLACRWYFGGQHEKNGYENNGRIFDRLDNFNSPDGWQCWSFNA